MLAKKKAEKQQAIAATAVAERKKELLRLKRQRDAPNEDTNSDDNNMNPGVQTSAKRPRRHAQNDHPHQQDIKGYSDPTLLSAEDPSSVLRAIGDHVNTRLQELDFGDDLDADLFDEQQRQLREEAALAAGTKTRILSSQIASILQQQQQQQQEKEKEAKHKSMPFGEASGVQMVRVGHNSNAITAVCSFGPDVIILGDKSGAVYVADLIAPNGTSQKSLLEPRLPASILTIAVSDTRGVRPSQRALFERSTVDTSVTSYLAAGAADGSIGVWVTATRKHMGLLLMHRKPVTGLAFRHDTLYSCSADETLRVWSAPQMMCQDKLFGHQGRVLGVSCLKRERCVTVGDDGTMRFWKVDAATQQEFTTSGHFDGVKVVLECVAMMSDAIVLCGAANGALMVFDVGRRKPLFVVNAAHGYGFAGDGTGLERDILLLSRMEQKEVHTNQSKGRQNPNPITAVAAIPYSDVAASASYDGVVRLWRLTLPENANSSNTRNSDNNNNSNASNNKKGQSGRGSDVNTANGKTDTEKSSKVAPTSNTSTKTTASSFECFASIPIDAIVTSLHFPLTSDVLVVGCGKEPRLGRWVVQREALNAVYIVPIHETALKALKVSPHVAHIPAQLYGIPDEEEAEEEAEEERSEHAEMNGSPSEEEDINKFHHAASKPTKRAGAIQVKGDKTPSHWKKAEDEDEMDEEGMFTIGDDGQMQFNPPTEGPNEANREMGKKKKKKKTRKDNNAMRQKETEGKGEIHRPKTTMKKTKEAMREREANEHDDTALQTTRGAQGTRKRDANSEGMKPVKTTKKKNKKRKE